MIFAYDQPNTQKLGAIAVNKSLTIVRTLLLMAPCWVLPFAGCTGEEAMIEPAFQAGSMDAINFEPFEAGDEMLLLSAVQSGLWLMPTLRYQGITGIPEISCIVIDLDQDAVLADREAHVDARELDGWITLTYNMEVIVPNMSSPEASDLEIYVGDKILFECNAVDEDGFTISLSHEMRLAIY